MSDAKDEINATKSYQLTKLETQTSNVYDVYQTAMTSQYILQINNVQLANKSYDRDKISASPSRSVCDAPQGRIN